MGFSKNRSFPPFTQPSVDHREFRDDLLVIRRGVPCLGVLGASPIHVRCHLLLVVLAEFRRVFEALREVDCYQVLLIYRLAVVNILARRDEQLLPLFDVPVGGSVSSRSY